ncbi:MAG: MarR family transcriptional regulator [Pseudomonadota bacterium]
MLSDADLEASTDMELTQFLTYRVVKLHNALNAQAVAVLDRVAGITLAQWRIIALVGSGTAKTARDIAQKSIIAPAVTSRTTRVLEEGGLVSTRRPSADRRVLELTLTAKGRQVYEETLPHMQARQRALLSMLSTAERDMILGIFDKLELAAMRREFHA